MAKASCAPPFPRPISPRVSCSSGRHKLRLLEPNSELPNWRLNGKPWQVPDSGFYTTVADVDYALKFLTEARAAKQPWYLYIAFNAPHYPLQAKKEDASDWVREKLSRICFSADVSIDWS